MDLLTWTYVTTALYEKELFNSKKRQRLCTANSTLVWDSARRIFETYAFFSTFPLFPVSLLTNICCSLSHRSQRSLSRWWLATMEFYWFYALIYDCVSCIVRWMDWIHVGLHVRRRCLMYSVFSGNCGHWKSCGRHFLSSLPFFAFL